MGVSVKENKATLSVKGFKRVNEFASPELLDDSELTVLKNYVLDQVGGVPCLRNPFQSYNANANSAALISMQDVLIGSTNYILGVDATALYKSAAGTGTWSSVKGSLTSGKIMRICQYSGKLYCVNGFDAPFQSDLTTTANLAITKPVVTSVTVTPAITGGSMAAGEYYYTLAYKDSNGNFSPPSLCLHATIASGVVGSVALAVLPTTSDKYLYRTKVGDGTFYLVAIIGSTTTTYTDTAADTSLDLSNTINYLGVPTSAFYPLVKNDRLFLGHVTLTPYNFPTFQSNSADITFEQVAASNEGLEPSSTYKYKMVLVFSDGTLSEPSDPVTHVTGAAMGGNGKLWIGLTAKFPMGFPNVTAIRFYRTVAAGSTYYFDNYAAVAVNPISRGFSFVASYFGLTTIPLFFSANSDASIVSNEALPSSSATTYGSRIMWSENAKFSTILALNFIDIYPDDGDVITGLVDDGDGILIWKTNNIYKLYTRGEPENYSVQKIVIGKGCSDPNTLIASPKGIFFGYRGHIYRYTGANAEPEDVSVLFQSTLGTVTSFMQAFYHEGPVKGFDQWVVFPVVISSTNRLLVYDTKSQTWYNFSTGGSASAFSAFSRQYGSDAGKLILSVTTTAGWYTEPTGTAGIDTYPASAAISGQLRTKTFIFPDGVPFLRPRFLWINALVITSFAITHSLVDPDAASTATVAQAATQTGVVRYITDSMTNAIKSAGKLYYDLTGTYCTRFYGFELAGTILNRGRRI